MNEQKDRTRFGVRLTKAGLDQVRELAETETEGNMSQMVRKLLVEALAARRRAQR